MPEPRTYIALFITHNDEKSPDWILELYDVEGVEKTPQGTKGFWTKDQWQTIEDKVIQELDANSYENFIVEEIPFINWNAEWESNFKPIQIKDFCLVRAPFHKLSKDVKFEIVIDPKMAFGTGHHATTWQMIEMMSAIDFADKSVLDYGSGTGILAILAKKMNASDLLAIDNDPLAVENMKENFMNNDTPDIRSLQSELASLDNTKYDVILANINRNVLLDSVEGLTQRANSNADLLMSGFYAEELSLLTEEYASDWKLVDHSVKDNWCCAHFQKEEVR